jgi:hypothetical protein
LGRIGRAPEKISRVVLPDGVSASYRPGSNRGHGQDAKSAASAISRSKLRAFPTNYSDYHETDAVGRRVEVCILSHWAIHYGIDGADQHVKIPLSGLPTSESRSLLPALSRRSPWLAVALAEAAWRRRIPGLFAPHFELLVSTTPLYNFRHDPPKSRRLARKDVRSSLLSRRNSAKEDREDGCEPLPCVYQSKTENEFV